MKLIFSWDDENTDANTPLTKNNVSGTIPDHNFQYDNTVYYYCTYGPSFCNQFISFLDIHID